MTDGESFDSNALEVDGIRFETVMPERVLTVPKKSVVLKLLHILKSLLPTLSQHPSPGASVQIGIRITNNTSTPLRFNFHAILIPELMGAEGQIPLEGGWISPTGPLESDFLLAMPGESMTFFPDAKIFWLWGNQFGLSITTGNSGALIFQPLNLDTYQFRFTYNNKNAAPTIYGRTKTDAKLIEGLWIGMVSTPFVEFLLE